MFARLGEACETRAWAGTVRCPAEVLEKELGDVAAILPHVGSATEATRQAMVDLATDNVLAVLQGRPPLTPVNPEVLSRLRR